MAADASPSLIHVPDLGAAGGELEIAGEEARYLTRVVRVRPGERVSATDGRGGIAALEILALGQVVRARTLSLERRVRAASLELWCGAPEGDRGDWLVEKLAELGVARLQPIDAERGAWEGAGRRAARWDRLALAALRQSRSPFRLEIRPPARLDGLVAALEGGTLWLCLPEGVPAAGAAVGRTGHTIAAVGPSSGFTAGEVKLLQSWGFGGLSLGPTRLRTETAALTVAALWSAVRGPGG